MKKIIAFLFITIVFLSSCASSKSTENLTIASQKGDCVGVMPMKCLLVKKGGQSSWEFFYNNIEGFEYEPGYEYVLQVKVEKRDHPAADQSALKYVLIKEISKEQKESEGLPKPIY